MAEEKSLWQRFVGGAKRVFSFPERKAEETRQKIQESINGPSKLRELAEDAKFSFQFPYPYGVFLHTFQPSDDREEALFDYMKSQLKEGVLTLEAHHDTLAKIGNGPVLRDLWQRYQSNDPSICKHIAFNRNCPADILEHALHDNDWEVRRNAVLNPSLSDEACIERAQHEANPFVKKALQVRLGDRFSQTEQFYAATQAQALARDGKAVAVDGPSIPVFRFPKDASILAQEINAFLGRHPVIEDVNLLKNLIAERGNTMSAFSDRTLHQRLLAAADTKMLDALYNYYTPADDKYMLREIASNPRSSEAVRMHFNSLSWARNDPARPRPALSSLINAAEIQGTTQQHRTRNPNHISKSSVERLR